MKVGFMCALFVALLLTACNMTQAQKTAIKDKVHQAIVKAVEEKGQPAAIEYVDKLLKEGKISANLAEKLKLAIPQGVEKLKEVLIKESEK